MSVDGKRVLLLGDSHTVGAYGDTLAALMRQNGATVTRIAHVGASARDYLNGRYAPEFRAAARQGADILIITLGTNDAAASDSIKPQTTAQNMKSLSAAVGAPDTFWVGPPAFQIDSARLYNPVFATKDLNKRADEVWIETSVLFGKKALDPRNVTRPYVDAKAPSAKLPKGDIHLGPAGGKAWAEFVFNAVQADSSGLATKISPEPQKGSALGILVAAAFLLIFALGRRAQSAVVAGLRRRR